MHPSATLRAFRMGTWCSQPVLPQILAPDRNCTGHGGFAMTGAHITIETVGRERSLGSGLRRKYRCPSPVADRPPVPCI